MKYIAQILGETKKKRHNVFFFMVAAGVLGVSIVLGAGAVDSALQGNGSWIKGQKNEGCHFRSCFPQVIVAKKGGGGMEGCFVGGGYGFLGAQNRATIRAGMDGMRSFFFGQSPRGKGGEM